MGRVCLLRLCLCEMFVCWLVMCPVAQSQCLVVLAPTGCLWLTWYLAATSTVSNSNYLFPHLHLKERNLFIFYLCSDRLLNWVFNVWACLVHDDGVIFTTFSTNIFLEHFGLMCKYKVHKCSLNQERCIFYEMLKWLINV